MEMHKNGSKVIGKTPINGYSKVMFEKPTYTERPIPHILPEGEREKWRHLPFDNAHNFRDMGGLKTTDGKTLKWGKLYRSGKLSKLSRGDMRYFAELGILRDVDFRSTFEQARDLDQIPQGIDYDHKPIAVGGNDIQKQVKDYLKGKIEIDLFQFMLEIYSALPIEYAKTYREWLHQMISDEEALPQLFHCSAGKDRTGFGAALIMKILNVPDEIIMEEYLLSNKYTKKANKKMIRKVSLLSCFRKKADDLKPLTMVYREYLNKAFEMIDAKWGDFQSFVAHPEGLALSPGDVDKLKDLLLN